MNKSCERRYSQEFTMGDPQGSLLGPRKVLQRTYNRGFVLTRVHCTTITLITSILDTLLFNGKPFRLDSFITGFWWNIPVMKYFKEILFTFLSQGVKCPGSCILHCSGGGCEQSAGPAGSGGGEVWGEGQELVWCLFLPLPLYIFKLTLPVWYLQITAGSAAQGEQQSPLRPSARGLSQRWTSQPCFWGEV